MPNFDFSPYFQPGVKRFRKWCVPEKKTMKRKVLGQDCLQHYCMLLRRNHPHKHPRMKYFLASQKGISQVIFNIGSKQTYMVIYINPSNNFSFSHSYVPQKIIIMTMCFLKKDQLPHHEYTDEEPNYPFYYFIPRF